MGFPILRLGRLSARMTRRGGYVAAEMPVLLHDHVPEGARNAIGDRDDCIAADNGERVAGPEAVLQLDKEQRVYG